MSIGDGLYKSEDGGSNWKKIGFEKSERISSIVINPNNTDEMYVGVLGALWSDSEERVLRYHSKAHLKPLHTFHRYY